MMASGNKVLMSTVFSSIVMPPKHTFSYNICLLMKKQRNASGIHPKQLNKWQENSHSL